MRKRIYQMALLLTAAVFLMLAGTGRKAWAKDALVTNEYTVDGKKADTKKFTLKNNRILYLTFDFKLSSGKSDGKDGVFFAIYDESDDSEVMSDTFLIEKGYTDGSFWIYSSDKIPAGKYRLEVEGQTKKSLKGTAEVYAYADFAESMGKLSDISVKTGKTKTVKLKDIKPSGALANASLKSGNNLVAQVYPDYGAGTIEVEGVGAGTTTVTATLQNGKSYSFTVKVKDPAPELNYKKFNLEAGYTTTIKLEHATGTLKWKSSNKKVATVDSKGLIKAKSKGKCKISTTYKGKKYTATVKVAAGVPWYEAKLTKYDVKKNTFTVKIKNLNKKNLIIYPTKAQAVQDNESALDRELKLSGGKKVTIKPGKSKTLKFKVQGDATYNKVSSFYVYYYMKYDGTKYYARTWTEGGAYKKGKKWYSGK